ncbi:thioesterase II family protein [Pseudonocardia sp. ICBG1142]|uniref:thioesterase II family protein n=1 Tax=Pseudonocardia sp. ICBG1142 TaxID=2846760 RepID=UPI001CF6551E|nr:thioesterase domain-containing protein [Pseudonocardia sp. ICBG1142]
MHDYARYVDRRWFKRYRPTDDARISLLCFHHAGGTAAMFRGWADRVPASVDLLGVQLPGRADRFGEPAHAHITPLVDDLIDAMEPLFDRPFALFGISMGARVAWSLAHELRERGLPEPRGLYPACDAGPITDDGRWPWENRADGLEGYMREMGGTPAAVLDQPGLLRALIPTLRCDLMVLSTHPPRPGAPLHVPIRAFAGVDDPVATPERVARWDVETTASFQLDLVPGGHFLSGEAEGRVVRTLAADLT